MKNEHRPLLIVEDDPGLARQLRWSLEKYQPVFASDREEALALVRKHRPAVVLQDLGLPPDTNGTDEGMACLQEILRLAPDTKVIVVTGNGDQSSAVRAIGLGAWDFHAKPLDLDVLGILIERAQRIWALEQEHRALQQTAASPLSGIIAASQNMLAVLRQVEKVAPTRATVLIQGETGTGKELIARALHRLSERAGQAFVAINCAAIPDTLLESELFGYEKGAFTGAARQTPGKIELADQGTLFLDEIGDMPLDLQAKMLRFLQERVIERLGGRREIAVDVRILCATHRDLAELIKSGAFREDLYYRISEIVIQIPPLRERRSDAIPIAQALLRRAAEQHGRTIRGFTPDALQAIEHYPWPGNVREMENRINRAAIMAENAMIDAGDLDLEGESDKPFPTLKTIRENAEREALERALGAAAGNLSKAAELLGISRPTLYDLLKRHHLTTQ